MPFSMNEDRSCPSQEQAIATVHAAFDAGVTLIDTADVYAPSWDQLGHNETLVGRAVRSFGRDVDNLLIATKGGITRSEGERWGRDGSLDHLRTAVERSLRALRVDVIDLYQWHRPDRWLVYADVIENFGVLRQEGKIRSVGISNADVEEIAIAERILGAGGLASVQNQFSPLYPSSFDELTYCAERGIAFLPWSPLGGTGGGARTIGERFDVFARIGVAHDVSPQRVVLAWELSLGDHVIPIPGARRPESIVDSAAAADLELSAEELARCSTAVGPSIIQ